MTTEISCKTADRKAFLDEVSRLSPFGNTPTQMSGWPESGDSLARPENWIKPCLDAKRSGHVSWDEATQRSFINVYNRGGEIIEVVAGEHRLRLDYFLQLAISHPIEVLCVGWDYFDKAARLMGYSRLGWGCLFKGKGHDFFVSPRWLEHGPWLLEHYETGITYVQFYDLALEGDAAWQQGRRAMERLSEGFFTTFGSTQAQLQGAYAPEDRCFSVVKTDQGIGQRELWRLCLLRKQNFHHATEPIERLRVTFTEERDARRHLHELWLREIECWALAADGRRVRLDLDYQPPERILPEWIEQHRGLAVSGPYTAVVPASGPAPTPGRGPGITADGVRLSLGLSSLTGPMSQEERRRLLTVLVGYRAKWGLRDVPARADSADAAGAFSGMVDLGESSPFDTELGQTEAALATSPFVVDVFLPPERIGLSLPALLVNDDFPSQAPIRAGDLGPAAKSATGSRLIGAMVLPVEDVLARVSALGRQDLRCAEDLLSLCAKHRLIVVARSWPPGEPKRGSE
jgi:hypothetical protein